MDMKKIGAACKAHREKLGLLQSDVAEDIGCSKENISSFECGRNDSAKILAWYVMHGYTLQEAKNGSN